MKGWSTATAGSVSDTEARSQALAKSNGTADTTGSSDTLRPVYAEMYSGVHSVDTLRYMACQEFAFLLPRHFYMQVGSASAVLLAVHNIEAPYVDEDDLTEFKHAIMRADPAVVTVKTARAAGANRPYKINMLLADTPHSGDPNIGTTVEPIEEPPTIKLPPRNADPQPPATNVHRLFPDTPDDDHTT